MAPLSRISNALIDILVEPSTKAPPNVTPTQTIQPILSNVFRRQSTPTATVTVVNNDGGNSGSSLDGGAIAGIVIGSIVGVLLLIWIIYSCSNLGAPPRQGGGAWYDDVSPERHRHHRSRSRHSYHSHEYPRRKYTGVRKVQHLKVVNSSPARPAYVYDPDLRRGRSGHRSRSRSRY